MKAKDIADRAAIIFAGVILKDNPNVSTKLAAKYAVETALLLETEAETQIKAIIDEEQKKNKEAFDAQRKAFELYKKEKLAKKEPPPTLPSFVKDDFDFGPQEG